MILDISISMRYGYHTEVPIAGMLREIPLSDQILFGAISDLMNHWVLRSLSLSGAWLGAGYRWVPQLIWTSNFMQLARGISLCLLGRHGFSITNVG